MSEGFKLACIQVNASDNLPENLDDAEHWARRAQAYGADFICFPECVSMMAYGRDAAHRNAYEETEHPALQRFCAVAKELNRWFLVGSLSVKLEPERVANHSYLIDASGNVVTLYDKIHMFDVELENGESYRESETYQAGNNAVLAETPWGRLGMTICYDLRFPYIYRDLALQGAMMISVPSVLPGLPARHTGKCYCGRGLLNAERMFSRRHNAAFIPGIERPMGIR